MQVDEINIDYQIVIDALLAEVKLTKEQAKYILRKIDLTEVYVKMNESRNEGMEEVMTSAHGSINSQFEDLELIHQISHIKSLPTKTSVKKKKYKNKRSM